jgi:hypothetical protein
MKLEEFEALARPEDLKGWVDHASNLPKQPLSGANNAAYTEAATGHTWIWTVPAGPSNVPRWIDR